MNDAHIIEHGSGLALSFVEHHDANQYLSIDLSSDCTLLLETFTFFQVGVHSIDWVDRKFKLTTGAC